MAQFILTVKNLDVSRNGEQVLSGINFSLQKGEVLIVLGPNGAGKTTLLKALLNLIPYSGTVTWRTKKISYLPPQELVARKDLPPMTVHAMETAPIMMIDVVTFVPVITCSALAAM